MFSGKTAEQRQAELDMDFLYAVADHNFGKADKLRKKGANVLAVDAEGNTAMHYLAKNTRRTSEIRIDENVCFLLNQGIDINAANKEGKTCLHVAAANSEERDSYNYFECTPAEQVEILLNRGADPNKADLEGRTPLFDAAGSPVEGHEKTEAMIENRARLDAKDNSGQIALHAAAANGIEDVVNMFLRLEPSLITTQDVEGKYPYQSAIAGAAGHHSLSRELLAKLEEFQADGKFKETMEDIAESTEKINTVTTEVQETMAAASDDDWRLLNPGQVEHTEKMSNYRLTHVFNFSARTYMQITHNLETKTDVVVTKSFDEFADKSLFEAAYGELKRLGGKADESVIHGPVIAKDKAKAPSL